MSFLKISGHHFYVLVSLSIFTIFSSLALHGESLQKIQQWVELERRIASEGAAWEADRALSENLIAIYRDELDLLEQQIADSRDDVSAAEAERAELVAKNEALNEITDLFLKQIIEVEMGLRALHPLLPTPLQQELSPAYAAMPENPQTSTSAIGQRMQPIVAMLTQIQRFNNTVTVVQNFRSFGQGEPIQVDEIYFGTGAAFYVDRSGVNAGIGFPGENGWIWEPQEGIANKVMTFLAVYRGTRQAEYINLPVNVR
jgi:hypothetical protein